MLNIIYEDKNLIALNKPAGVNFDWALEFRNDLIPAHRLDKETSGVILFAKSEQSAEHLKNLFQTRQIKKTYRALVVGVLKQNSGLIELSIGRSERNPLKRISVGKKVGKLREAETYYEVEKRFAEFTLLKVEPKTGRTHQIRSHLSAIHHPVVCDKMYGGKNMKCPAGLGRQFLHAESIEFEGLKIEADLPEDLKKVLDMLA
ncbi:MAG: RluA family pseudouridine synthase [Patescibacteria group bacterium]